MLSPRERVDVEIIKGLPHPINNMRFLNVPLIEDPHVLFMGKTLNIA